MWTVLSNATTRNPGRRPPRPRRFVPRLVPLEDRLAPAAFTVTTKFDLLDPADGKLSLREAISRTNANPGPDTITLPAGVYKTTRSGYESSNLAGDFNIQDSVTIWGASAATTVVDGGRLDRVFDIFGPRPARCGSRSRA